MCLAVSQPPGHYGPVGLAEGTVSMHLLHSSPFTADGMEEAGPGLTVRPARCEKACRGGTVSRAPEEGGGRLGRLGRSQMLQEECF